MDRETPLILVVDDESHIVHVVSLKLRNAGYEVITAEDGEEGLDVALENEPDLVVTDYQMPYMTGLEMCKALKENEVTCSTPALMLTARGFKIPQEELDHTNIHGVISKPFSPREILSNVQELIGASSAASSEESS